MHLKLQNNKHKNLPSISK